MRLVLSNTKPLTFKWAVNHKMGNVGIYRDEVAILQLSFFLQQVKHEILGSILDSIVHCGLAVGFFFQNLILVIGPILANLAQFFSVNSIIFGHISTKFKNHIFQHFSKQ